MCDSYPKLNCMCAWASKSTKQTLAQIGKRLFSLNFPGGVQIFVSQKLKHEMKAHEKTKQSLFYNQAI